MEIRLQDARICNAIEPPGQSFSKMMAGTNKWQEEGAGWRRAGLLALLVLAFAPVVYRLLWRETSARGENGSMVTIQYMTWGNPQQLETERVVIGRFNDDCSKQGKPIRVEMFMPPAGGYRQKLLTMLASGKAPDVARVDHFDFASIAAKGYFKDLSAIAANDPDFHPEDFHPSAMRENYYHGHLHAMGMLFGGLLCYYNESLFRSAGLEDPYQLWKEGKWSWAAFEDVAARMTLKNSAGQTAVYGFSFGDQPPGSFMWSLWLWRERADYLTPDHQHCTLNTPQAKKAFTDMRDLIDRDHVAPSPSVSISNGYSFESGNVAMDFEFAGNAPRYRDTIRDFEWDIAPTPSDPDNSYTMGKGNQLIITEQCQHPQAAWEWIKYLTSRETEEYFYGDEYRRCVPTRLAVLRSPEYLHATRPPFHIDVYVDVVNRARELPIDELYPTWVAAAQRMVDVLFLNPSANLDLTLGNATAAADQDIREERELYERYVEQGR